MWQWSAVAPSATLIPRLLAAAQFGKQKRETLLLLVGLARQSLRDTVRRWQAGEPSPCCLMGLRSKDDDLDIVWRVVQCHLSHQRPRQIACASDALRAIDQRYRCVLA